MGGWTPWLPRRWARGIQALSAGRHSCVREWCGFHTTWGARCPVAKFDAQCDNGMPFDTILVGGNYMGGLTVDSRSTGETQHTAQSSTLLLCPDALRSTRCSPTQTALFWLGCVHSGTGGPWPALAAEGPRFGPRLAGPQRGCGRQGIGEGGGSHGGGHRPHIVYTWVEMGVPCGGGGGHCALHPLM